VHEVVHTPGLDASRFLAFTPLGSVAGAWVGVTPDGVLVRVDVARRAHERIGALPEGAVDLAYPIDLHLSRDGSLAAIVEAKGTRGVVLSLPSGTTVMAMERGDYEVEHCRFPVAFVEHAGRTFLVHGTDWNRLDVSDPVTGALLTARAPASYSHGEERPEHYLDYFHGRLRLSPDGATLADDGWVWHPCGIVRVFHVGRWLDESPWESEDGSSVRTLCGRVWYWDGPMCWIDARTLAVWGLGEDDTDLVPGVRLFDATTGDEIRSFAGPSGELVYDEHLVSISPDVGAAVWDVATGERLATDASLRGAGHHPGDRSFVTRLPDGAFRVSRLAGR
jgi:hypothetical protein